MKRATPIQGIRCKLRVVLKNDGLTGKFKTYLVKIMRVLTLVVSYNDKEFTPSTFFFMRYL